MVDFYRPNLNIAFITEAHLTLARTLSPGPINTMQAGLYILRMYIGDRVFMISKDYNSVILLSSVVTQHMYSFRLDITISFYF